MTEKQYYDRRAVIMGRIDIHGDKFSDGRTKYPRCLAADLKELQALDEQYQREGGAL